MSLTEWIRDLIGFNWISGGNSYFVNKLVTGGTATSYDADTETLTLAEAGSGGAGSITASYSTEMGVLDVPGVTNIRAGSNVSFAFPVAGICQINAAAPAIDPSATVISTLNGRRVEQYGTVALTASGKFFGFIQSPGNDVKAKTEVNATIVGGSGLLRMTEVAEVGDRVLLNVTFAANDHLVVNNMAGTVLVDETVTAAGKRSYTLVYTSTGWEAWVPAGSVLVNGAPVKSVATGSDFPVSIAAGVATLDPLNLLPRAKWRRNQALSIALASDAPSLYVRIGPMTMAGVEGMESLNLDPTKSYAAVISSRVMVVETANQQHYAFVDMVFPVTIVGLIYYHNYVVDPTAAAVSVVATSTMTSVTATVLDTDWSIELKVTRPPGVACTVLRHDTAIIEIQEIA